MDHPIGREIRRAVRRLRPASPALGVALMLGCWAPPAGSGETDGAAGPDASTAATRVATATHEVGSRSLEPTLTPLARDPAHAEADPIARAKRAIADCQSEFRAVKDYTCKLYKRERIDGKMVRLHVMSMKARTNPVSFYFKFDQPNAGREAIFVAGKNKGKVLAHDVGLTRVLAGTMNLDPKGSFAMEENRHPITEAGIGVLIDTIRHRWDAELRPDESKVVFHPSATVDGRPCTLIETTHPSRQDDFLFHKVKLYIDRELTLPIRFEAYDWPKKPGLDPELVEEYTYAKLRVNVGLHDRDFDAANPQYAFGRF